MLYVTPTFYTSSLYTIDKKSKRNIVTKNLKNTKRNNSFNSSSSQEKQILLMDSGSDIVEHRQISIKSYKVRLNRIRLGPEPVNSEDSNSTAKIASFPTGNPNKKVESDGIPSLKLLRMLLQVNIKRD